MDRTSLAEMLGHVDRLRCGEAVAVFAPRADELAASAHRADDVRELAGLMVCALLGVSEVPAGWAERAFASGVPAGLVTVLAAALSPERPTARELATALRETCDPVPLDRLVSPPRSGERSPESCR